MGENNWTDDRVVKPDKKKVIDKVKTAETIYTKKLKSAQRNNYLIKVVCNLIIIVCMVNLLATCVMKIEKKRQLQHTEITADMLNVYNETIEKQVYEVSYEEKYTLDDVTYYDLKVGPFTILAPESIIVRLKNNTMIETEIYHLTIENTDKYLLSNHDKKAIEFIRIPELGGENFTDKEVKRYTEKAAKYFTYNKYKRLRFSEAEDYSVELDDMVY